MTQKRNPILLKKQWLGLAVLAVMIVVIRLFVYFLPKAEKTEYSIVNDSINNYFTAKSTFKRDTVVLRLRPFDPNTADSITLRQLGLRPWQIRNLLKYRAANGRFRKKEDFRKLYGLTDSAYAALEPFITIVPVRRDTFFRDTIADSLRVHYVSRKRDTIIELNSADTGTLQFIRGIGPYTATRIVLYRKQLGGYVSAEQLREIDRMPHTDWDSIIPHFTVCRDSVRRIPLNNASLERLYAHPYLSFTQAKTLYTLRRRHIYINSMDKLKQMLPEDSVLRSSDIERLAPYLDFSKQQK